MPRELGDEHPPLQSTQPLRRVSPAPAGSTEFGVGSSPSSLQEVEDEAVCSPAVFVLCLLLSYKLPGTGRQKNGVFCSPR